MNTCPNCGKVAGGHSSILQGCVCQYSMQAPPQPEQKPVGFVHIKDGCLVGSHRDNSKPLADGQYGLWPVGTTPPQPEQKPIAWRKREVGGGWQYHGWEETGMTYESVKRINKNGFECEAIPATPPQRTWQGLTAGEILDTLISVDEKTVRLPSMLGQFACAIEAKLKEKNNG